VTAPSVQGGGASVQQGGSGSAEDYREYLRRLTEGFRPASILALGPDGEEVFGAYCASHPECRLALLAREQVLDGLAAMGRFDLGFVSGVLEHLDREAAGTVLARLRDVHTQRFFALLPMGGGWPQQRSRWEPGDLLGYGMRLVGRYVREDKPVHLYGFDLHDYKTTPDWLNSRYWAHPELWDRYRW
jgi:Family of unknown function (DUF6231)